jgi:hypothetical protein
MYSAQKVAQLISRWTGLKDIRFYVRLPDEDPTAGSAQDCSKTIMGAFNNMSQLRSLYIFTGVAVLPLDEAMILSLVTSCPSLYRMSFGTSMCTISMDTLLALLHDCPELNELPVAIDCSSLPRLDLLDGFVHPKWGCHSRMTVTRIGKARRLAMFIAAVLPGVYACDAYKEDSYTLDRKKVKKVNIRLHKMWYACL